MSAIGNNFVNDGPPKALMLADLSYLLRFDDDVLPLHGSMTIGRHLDCDAVVAGEDVLDFHLRIEVDDRGPVAHPLQDATFNVNGTERSGPYGLCVGDTLSVGSVALQIGLERELAPQAEEWWLFEEYGEALVRLDEQLLIGRQNDCDVVVPNDHVSRHHARLVQISGAVWVCDLDSANGTLINDDAVIGSRRLLHGDVVRFDEEGYQLIGRGGEITGVRRRSANDLAPLSNRPEKAASASAAMPTETAAKAVDTTELGAVPAQAGEVVEPDHPGVYLVGASAPISGHQYRLAMGRSLVGRDSRAVVRIQDASVSSRHAELVVRPEGVTLTNLMATNGTFVNEQPVRVAALMDSDRIRIGRVQLVYRRIEESASKSNYARWMLYGGASLAAIVCLLLLL